jgi:hypothetical protein
LLLGGGGSPPPLFPRGWCSVVLLRPCCIARPQALPMPATALILYKPPKKRGLLVPRYYCAFLALACQALDDLYGQDSVRSSDGFDGMYNEGDSDGLECYSHFFAAGRGKNPTCKDCTAGRYQEGSCFNGFCKGCPSDYYQNSNKQVQCISCPVAYYQPALQNKS